jgi:O-antigen/teichoic acid export membrane protein
VTTVLARLLRPSYRRAGWNLLDQVISSGTNAALSFLVARSVSETAFGGFAVALTVFALLIGVSRAMATSPLGIRFSDAGGETYTEASAAAVGTGFCLGAAAGAGCLIVAAMLDGPTRAALLALGVVLPGMLVQDAWRQVFFAAGRPARAALNDAVWAVVQLVAVTALLIGGASAIAPLVLAWGGAAAAAALLGVRQAGMLPRPRRTRKWLADHRDLTGYLVTEFATQQGGMQGALLLIAAVGSLAAIGALRGGQTLLGPTTILAVAAESFAVPEFSRRRGSLNRAQWLRGALGVSAVVGALGFCWGLIFLLAPDVVGAALLGATWPGTSAVLLAMVLGQLGQAIALGPSLMLLAMDRAPVAFAISAIEAVLALSGGVGGVLLAGAQGAAWGFTIAFWAVAPLSWIFFCAQATWRSVSVPPS